MEKRSIMKNYRFLAIMLSAMIAGCLVGWFAPDLGMKLKPLGTVFINMMFCVVVPLVFASISSSIAGMKSRRRADRRYSRLYWQRGKSFRAKKWESMQLSLN